MKRMDRWRLPVCGEHARLPVMVYEVAPGRWVVKRCEHMWLEITERDLRDAV